MKTEEMFRRDPRIDPYMAAVILTWLAAAGSLAVMLLLGVRGTDRFSAARGVLHLAYAAALLLYLAHRRPSIAHLPESALGHAANGRVGQLAAAGAAFVLCVVGLLDPGLFLLLLAAAAIVMLAAWRRQLTMRAIVLGLAASAVAFLTGGIAFWRHGFVAKPMLIFMLVAIPPMFAAGGLLRHARAWVPCGYSRGVSEWHCGASSRKDCCSYRWASRTQPVRPALV